MNKDEIINILSSDNKEILLKADKIRKMNVGDEVHLRALIEFSNFCHCNCKYCGLQAQNTDIKRYRLSKDEILQQAKKASELGYKTIVLQSGEDCFYDADKICEIIKEIKKFDVALTLSIGEKSYDEYAAYKKAGADRYLLRIETTDKKLYQDLHPKADFNNRLRCLENLKSLGYEVGSGSLIGLVNQTISSIADDILFFKTMDFDMIGVGPFIAHPKTPLKSEPNGDFNLTIKVIALIRTLMPTINIPATTAIETLHPMGQLIALQSGANVIMPNFTPSDCQKNYEIYPDKFIQNNKKELEKKLNSINRTISKDYGYRKK